MKVQCQNNPLGQAKTEIKMRLWHFTLVEDKALA